MAFDERYATSDGRTASLGVDDGVLSVDIEWESGREQWQSAIDDEALATTIEGYQRTLAAAGFRRTLGGDDAGHSRLPLDGALALAETLGGSRPAIARIIELGLQQRHDALRRACTEARAKKVRVGDVFEHHRNDDVVALHGGRYLWTWDDDGHGDTGSDPLPEGLNTQLARRTPELAHAQVFGNVERWAQTLWNEAQPFAPTHLVMSAGSVGAALPPTSLRALTGSAHVLASWLRDPDRLANVEALTLSALPDAWETIAALPNLRNLGVWSGRIEFERMLGQLPEDTLAALRTVDLFSVEGARGFPFQTLLDQRARFDHLQQILLGGHLVPDEVRAQFADWPQVLFVSHDRIEALGHDLRCIGFPSAHR